MSGERSSADHDVDPARLKFAMTLGGYPSYAALQQESGVSSDTLRGWHKQRVERPSPSSQSAVEGALPVTFDFLTDHTPLPPLRNVNFRNLQSTEENDRAQMRAYLTVAALTAQGLLGTRAAPIGTMPLDSHGVEQGASVVAAAKFRSSLGMGSSPAPNLVRVAEKLGVLVAYGPRQTANIDACSGWVGANPIIVLNPAKGDHYRQRWDMAHELGHLVLHRQSRPPSNRTAEAQAEAFAEALLFPPYNRAMARLKAVVSSSAPFSSLVAFQEEWDISVDALLYRLSRGARGSLRDAVIRRQKEREDIAPKSEPVGSARPAEEPTILADAVDELRAEHGAPFASIAWELGLKPELLSTLVARRLNSVPM